MKPLIGLPAQRYEVIDWKPRVQGQRQSYVEAIEAADGLPIIVPLLQSEETLRALYERLDGLLLCGGEDFRADRDHDQTELQLTRWALADQKPILAICRGLQLLNVARGGTLIEDLPTQRPSAVDHRACQAHQDMAHQAHQLLIKPGTRLADIVGRQQLTVNSQHHQAIDRLGEGLYAVGHAEDGVVEAVEGAGFVIGVQHHPEALLGEAHWLQLFRQFIVAARPVSYGNLDGSGRIEVKSTPLYR